MNFLIPDKKPTDNDIVKALECCCKNNNCEGCPLDYLTFSSQCASELAIKSLDLINRQKAEIERLTAENKLLIDNDVSNKYPNCVLVEKGRIYTRTLEDYDELISDISAEAYKEFAEKVNKMLNSRASFSNLIESITCESIVKEIDNLLKELVGDDK